MKCIQLVSLRSTLYKEKLAHGIMYVCSSVRPSPLNKFGTDRYIFMNLVFSSISVKKNYAFQASTHEGLQLILNTFQFLLYFHFVSDRKRDL